MDELAGLVAELTADLFVIHLGERFPGYSLNVTRANVGCTDAQGRRAISCVFRTGPISEQFEQALSRLTTLLVRWHPLPRAALLLIVALQAKFSVPPGCSSARRG